MRVSNRSDGDVVATGSLAIVGIGIQSAGQVTLEARTAIERADLVLFAVADGVTARWLRILNPRAQSFDYPRDDRARREIYTTMAERMLAALRAGQRVCAVFYGSPSTLTQPSRLALRQARAAGYAACLLPAVSFIECLLVDLDIDPGEHGCQIFEASALLRTRRTLDACAHLIIAQPASIGVCGRADLADAARVAAGLALLQERLQRCYPRSHRVVIYEASSQPLAPFRADRIVLGELSTAALTERSSLYVSPLGPAPADEEMCRQLERLVAGRRVTNPKP